VSVLAALPVHISGHASALLSAEGGGEGFKDKYPLGPQSFVFKSMWDFTIFGLTVHVTRLVTMMLTATFLIIVFYLLASRNAKIVPNRLQFMGESIYGFIRNGVAREVIGPEEGLKFAPYLTCLFSFILFLNLYEILPLAQTPVTGRIAIPGVLALISWAMFNYVGIKKHGAGAYFKEMCFPPGVPKPLYVLLTPIEIFSTLIARPFTLAVRLLMNMFAGHLLLLVFTTGTLYLATQHNISKIFTPVAFLMAVLLTFFELLVIAIQSYVFTVLTAVYVSGALAEEH
jgi:F-type H+-transporting ATPase subunit a